MPNLSKYNQALLSKSADTIRFLSADMVQNASSGHPGAPMGLADILTTLSLFIHISPNNPRWLNRDRIVFSGGHASALVYSMLHLWGFDISIEDLKNFRKLDSITPGHPEYRHTPGVEITTGPLGQGVANAVGFAMASLRAKNILGKELISHNVFCLCGDGDLEEGISYEACSLAGLHNLDNLILIYDSNKITIEGDTKISFNENIKQRFIAQGWEVFECDGHDFESIYKAISLALDAKAPSIIIANTTIGKKAIGLEGSHKTHGAPLGEEVIASSKKAAGFDETKKFYIDEDVKLFFESLIKENGELYEKKWQKSLESSGKKSLLDSILNPNFDNIKYPTFDIAKPLATRVSNGAILNAIAQELQAFIGGSADLSPSNNTELKGLGDFPHGSNLHFGIREHSMAAISNAFSNYGIFIPFCATFFVFSDYLNGAMRVSALSNTRIFYIFTHDSIGVGEDGATHEPIEQLSHLRSLPNLVEFRPSDAIENIACFKVALELNSGNLNKIDSKSSPIAFVLSRQNLPINSHTIEEKSLLDGVRHGAYILKDAPKPDITLIASGSEVYRALQSANILEQEKLSIRVVSAPSFSLLTKAPKEYVKSLFSGKVIALESARALEWHKYADMVIGMDSFGASGKGEELFERYGFDDKSISKKILKWLKDDK